MSMSFSPFYGISLQKYFGDDFIRKLKEISEDVEEVYENLYLADEFDDDSDIVHGIFVNGYEIPETKIEFSDFIKDKDLNEIISKIISEAKKHKLDTVTLEEALLKNKNSEYVPNIMSVYI